jgi:hypothetical protein
MNVSRRVGDSKVAIEEGCWSSGGDDFFTFSNSAAQFLEPSGDYSFGIWLSFARLVSLSLFSSQQLNFQNQVVGFMCSRSFEFPSFS